MSAIAAAVVGGGLVGSVIAGRAAKGAAETQAGAAQAGIAAQQTQFEALQKNLQPYMQAGTGALSSQQALLGLLGPEQQAAAIAGLQQSPQMQAMQAQGENALLQNASATGGLRGGNIQAALGQFRPQLLNQMIQQQYSNLGGLTSLGQASAAGVGQAGMGMAGNISNLLQQQGAAQAGGILGQAGAYSGGIQNTVGSLLAAKAMKMF